MVSKPGIALACVGGVVAVGMSAPVAAQDPGTVLRETEISSGTGGFGGVLDDVDHFGHAVACLEDLDGDGVTDMLVGAPDDDDGGTHRGAVWVLFLEPSGAVRAQQKISHTQGGFTPGLRNADLFGSAVATLGDLDGDGTTEVSVGAEMDDDGGLNRGAVWILSLGPTGTVVRSAKISQVQGGFTGVLRDAGKFGSALAALDDLDGDGIRELAVGTALDNDGGSERGAVWVLFLDAQGRVRQNVKLSSTSGGLAGPLLDGDHFGHSVASIGDLDHDGLAELAVGAVQDDDGGLNTGAVWVLFLGHDGSVRSETKIAGAGAPPLDLNDYFGSALACPGDVDGDGTPDLAVGAYLDDDGGLNTGAVWILFLNPDGSMKGQQKISSTSGGLPGPVSANDWLGCSLAAMGDLDGDHKLDLIAGAQNDDNGGRDRGAVHVLFLESVPLPSTNLVVRNGLGVNPVLLSSTENAVLGSPWTVTIDCRGFNHGVLFHLAVDRPLDCLTSGRAGEILIDWRRPQLLGIITMHDGGEVRLTHQVPPYVSLANRPFYSQALVMGRGGARLTNALDGVFLARSP